MVPGDIEPVKIPLSVAIGDEDFAMGIGKVREVKGILEGKGEGRYEVVIYEGAKHGFANRGDLRDGKGREEAGRAEDQAVRWFGRVEGLERGKRV